MLESLLNRLDRHRRITLGMALLAFVVGACIASRLTVNDSCERWLPASSLDAWRRFEEHYTYGDTIAVATQFHRPVVDGDIALLKAIREDLARIDGIAQVDGTAKITDVSRVAEQVEGVSLTEFLRTPKDGEEDRFAMYRGVLFDDPRQREADGVGIGERTLLTFIELAGVPTSGLDAQVRQDQINAQRRHVVAAVYKVLEEHRRDDVTYHVAGGVVIQYEMEKIARRIVVTILPVALVLTLSALAVGFRSLTTVAIALGGGLWSVVVMLGVVAAVGWSLNVVTVGGPTLMVIIVITTTVHFAHYFSGHDGQDVRSSGRSENPHFIRWVAVPCLGAAMVTGVGFLMLAFNELGPARELGIELFGGAVLAFLGAFLAWLAMPRFHASVGRWLSASVFRRFHRLVVARPWPTTLILLAGAAALLAATLRVRVDADPFSFFQPRSRIARAFAHFSERKFGLYILDVVLIPRDRPEDPAQRDAARKEDLRIAMRFQQRIRQRPEVRNVISAVDLQARQAGLQSGSERRPVESNPGPRRWWKGFTLKDLGSAVEKIAALNKDLKRLNAFKSMFKDWTTDRAGEGALRISFMVYDTGDGFRPLLDEVRRSLPEDRFTCFYTGTAENVVTLSENLVGGITRGLIAAAAVMALLCVTLFRSLRLTVIAVLPNALPVLVVFGVMGIFSIPLNSGSAMVSTIALGVGLTDTVHFMMHYRRRRHDGETTDGALADTFAELGRPIVLTSVVNCIGFAVFLLSDFRPTYHFGLLASVAMMAALVGDLVLLPNLLKLADRGRV